MDYKIEELVIENIGSFYDGISLSFIPGYEIENKVDFEDFVHNELRVDSRTYFQILNDKLELIGGFRKGRKGLSYFFLEGNPPEILTDIKSLMSDLNLKRIYTKKRYAHMLLNHNFSPLFERYIMVLNLKQPIQDVESEQIKLFTETYLDESASIKNELYKDPLNRLIFGNKNKEIFKKELQSLLSNKNDLQLIADSSFVYLIDDKVIGFIIIGKYLDKPMILDLAVKKEFQAKGIGKQLVIKSVSTMQNEYTELLLMVTKGNDRAENLYKSIGFIKIADNLVALEKRDSKKD